METNEVEKVYIPPRNVSEGLSSVETFDFIR